MPDETTNDRMSRAVGVWAKKRTLRPKDFCTAMGWSYNHAWRVLRGRDPFTPSAYGKFLMAYGVEALNEIFRAAGITPNQERK